MCEEVCDIEKDLIDRIHAYSNADFDGDHVAADCFWDAVQEALQALIEKIQEKIHETVIRPRTVHEEVLQQVPEQQVQTEGVSIGASVPPSEGYGDTLPPEAIDDS